jgi:hypothetical protein
VRTGPRHLGLLVSVVAEDAQRDRVERLRALRSASGVLAGAGSSARASSAALADLARAGLPGDASEGAEFDASLDRLEREMRKIALETPIDRLRATLAEGVVADRRGVLDLLDLVVGAELEGPEGIDARIPALDLLITLLCTGGNPHGALHDPVLLTERLQRLCERSDVDYDARLPELEAEFYAAANLREAELRNDGEQRALRRRKVELGPSFFAPRVLRAIVTYNAALMRRTDDALPPTRDAADTAKAQAPATGCSLFELPALPKLAEALRRRTAGQPPGLDPIDRIAWCLDLNDLTRAELEALLSESTGRREGIEGTTVLLGLLCRSSVVLDEEYPAIGIATHELTGAWSRELADLLQQEVNRRIAKDYGRASRLTELKSRFLTVTRPKQRTPRAAPPQMTIGEPADERSAQSARSSSSGKKEPEPAPPRWRQWPWAATARVSAIGLVAGVALLALVDLVWSEGRVGDAELEQLSPYLSHGKRSDAGAGTAFVGTLEDAWSALEPARQQDAADALVAALRERGVREIMVYDDEQRLRIQALGEQPARIIR